MNGISLLQDLLETIVDRGASLARLRNSGRETAPGIDGLAELGDTLLSARGEASGAALSAQFLAGFAALDASQHDAFFSMLADRFDPSFDDIQRAAGAFAATPDTDHWLALEAATESPRRRLLRRLNMAPGATAELVTMRKRLMPLLKTQPELRRVDHDFLHLFRSWFNRGFLILRQIDWSTPANILEKIIAYEAVHAIDSWDELRRRLLPEDRRCFAFFHPSMPDDPLIFVEVALTGSVPDSIQSLLAGDRDPLLARDADTAVFYSISNCQPGLARVSFGSFLIKRVAQELSRELPSLNTFVTLSPVPGLMQWLQRKAENDNEGPAAQVLSQLGKEGWHNDEDTAAALREPLLALACEYFGAAKNKNKQPLDPVARFHLGNGAVLHRIHWLADTSAKGLAQSAGIMVNYLYELNDIEEHHEAYADHAEIAVSKEVRTMAPQVFGKR
ncbi:malonyl-CoA decarboxylase family protein [Granulosicoccaceae sp. 1_MG-2023]|nr:malonyl-CoA decarboxylase family protein [Granulosicoccaceae sp. 1_MG-2023]